KTQKRWRTLGIFPDTFDVAAVAATWKEGTDTQPEQAQDTLSSLLEASMLEWNDALKRYRLHDLMRDFARSRLAESPSELDDARSFHAAHYFQVLRHADTLYQQGGDAVMQSLAQFDLEWGNIQAGQAWAAGHTATNKEAAQLCSDYADRGAFLLYLR